MQALHWSNCPLSRLCSHWLVSRSGSARFARRPIHVAAHAGRAGLRALSANANRAYFFVSIAQRSGTLMLDAQSNPAALFVFQIGSALTTASHSAVQVLNGGTNTGVYWQVGASATLGTDADFLGNLIAEQAVTLNSRARILCCRAIALNAALRLNSNDLSRDCLRSSGTTGGPGNFGSFG